jgi:hypothetical protein
VKGEKKHGEVGAFDGAAAGSHPRTIVCPVPGKLTTDLLERIRPWC